MIPAAVFSQKNPKLETVATFGENMAIGLSVNSENRVFVSFPNGDGDNTGISLAEVKGNSLVPYPNQAWNETKLSKDKRWIRVQDVYVDDQDFLWVLDSKPGAAGNIFGKEGEQNGEFKLVAINTRTNEVEKSYTFESLDLTQSALNDVRVDTRNNKAYFSDPGLASIVVLDLETREVVSRLEKSDFTIAKEDIVLEYNGKPMVDKDGNPFSSNINSIALSPDGKYFYFKPINHHHLFRIETQYLANNDLSDQQLAEHVEDLGKVGVTHGMVADKNGNIYLTTSESFSISYIDTNGKLHTLVKSPELLWPDSLGVGTDGYLYFTCAQMQHQPNWNSGQNKTEFPFKAFRVKLP